MDLPHLISIVGAGPGDPELLTVKAQKRIANADVILFDALPGNEILELTPPDCEKIYAGKSYHDGQNQNKRQQAIYRYFLKYAAEGKKVVRLKGGDPMIFGRGSEEIRFCKAHQLTYEVIPGVTAGIAGAGLFNISLTERGVNNMALLYTGHAQNGSFTDIDSLVPVLQSGSPVVVYMGLHNLPQIAEALINRGIDKNTTIQILSNISKDNQTILTSSLAAIETTLRENKPDTPALIIIGENAQQI